MSPVAGELTVGELLAFDSTRPDLTATLTVSKFEPTFHQHQTVAPTPLIDKSHDLRELYASGHRSIEVRSPCTSIVEHMPTSGLLRAAEATVSDNVDNGSVSAKSALKVGSLVVCGLHQKETCDNLTSTSATEKDSPWIW
ncbi:BQ5605_C001g00872 [Microbotryum silenes-dioicae]|uniref:BQ5605_C001g00872 protein n=1 Tax=Microbotryum silenes-dioicae TaxID=796604 RepID=A0A2X0MS06_9BASI|nr:BQ5605_C001g00872 [Microbotryum silenes-dioicae]